MTVSLTLQDPAPDATGVSPRPFIRLSMASSDPSQPVLPPNVNVEIGGRPAFVGGFVQSGFEAVVTNNAFFGFDLRLRCKVPFDASSPVGVHVVCVPDVDVEWNFTIGDTFGPEIHLLTPANGSDGLSATPTIQFDIVDAATDRNVQRRVLEASSSDGVLSGSQLSSDTIDFRNKEGRLVIVNAVPMFIVAIIGPHICTVTGSGGGSGLPVELYRPFGIDVTVNTAKIIKSGQVDNSLGWTTTLTQPLGDRWRVNAVRTGSAFSAGAPINFSVRAADDDPDRLNYTELLFGFTVGDVTPPVVGNVTPKPGSRGLATATSTHIQFDVVDPGSGVDSATLNVKVDGAAAVTAGAAVGNFSTSTVTPITDGYRVVLIKGSSWTSNKEVMIEVDASDADANVMGKLTWLYHFGTAVLDVVMNSGGGQLVANDVVRVIAFDFSDESFGRPEDLRHNGYAADGFHYNNGAKEAEIVKASWFLEGAGANRSSRASFPLSGYFVVTSGSWSIIDSLGVMWMRCSALGSGSALNWSMAGGVTQPIADADVNREPVLFLAAGPGVVIVDFVLDAGFRINTSGRGIGGTIVNRSSDQIGGQTDTSYALAASTTPFAVVTGLAWQDEDVGRNLLFIAGRDTQLEMAVVLDPKLKAEILVRRAISGSAGNVDRKTALLPVADASTWKRLRVHKGELEYVAPLIFAYSSSGAVRVGIADWVEVLVNLASSMGTLSSSSTPALPSDDAVDCEQVYRNKDEWLAVVAMKTQTSILSLQKVIANSAIVKTLSLSDLGLSGLSGVNPRLSAIAIEKTFEQNLGHVYAAALSDNPSAAARVARYRHQSATALSTGQVTTLGSQRMTSIAAVGKSGISTNRFVRAALQFSLSPDVITPPSFGAIANQSEVNGVPFSFIPSVSNPDVFPITYSMVGTLPTGLSINSGTGEISGTCSSDGITSGLKIRATYALGHVDSNAFSIQVYTVPSIAHISDQNMTQGTPFTFTPSVTNPDSFVIVYSMIGSLPSGVSIDSSTGIISGTPTVNGTFSGLQIRMTYTFGHVDSNTFNENVASSGPPGTPDSYWSGKNVNGALNVGLTDGDLLSLWHDNGVDARDFISSGTARPVFKATASLHGGPCVQVQSALPITKMTAAFPNENEPLITLGFIMRINPAVANGQAFDFFSSDGAGGNEFFAAAGYNNAGIINGAVAYRGHKWLANTGYDDANDSGWMAVTILCNGASSKINIQVTGQLANESTGDVGGVTTWMNYTIGNGIDGFIEEAVVYKSDEYTALKAYLAAQI